MLFSAEDMSGRATGTAKPTSRRKLQLLLASVACAALAPSEYALAQATDDGASADAAAVADDSAAATAAGAVASADVAAAESEADGADIYVIGRKRGVAEKLQDVPIAITVLPKDLVEDGNFDELSDFVELVPNTNFAQESNTSSEISIRGSGRNLGDEDQSVGTYRDGVYVGGLLFSTANFYDVSHVEILRGPQAGLYGRNAVGGAISVTSERPKRDLGGYVDVLIGSKGRKEVRGAINVPVIDDKWALRVAGIHLDQDRGFDKIVNHDQYVDAFENSSIRLRSLVTPNEDLEFLTTIEYLKTDGGGGLTVPAPDAALGYLDQDRNIPIPGTDPDDTDEQLRNFKQLRRLKQWQAIQEINWTTDAGIATAIASYRSSDFNSRRDEDLTEFDVSEIAFDAGQDSFFAEARFASRDMGGFKFVAGASYLNEEVKLNFTNRIGGAFAGAVGGASIADLYAAGVVTPEWAPVFSALAGFPVPVGTSIALFGMTPGATGWGGFLGDTFPTEFINEQKLKSFAFFGEANYQLTDSVELWANLRYTHDKKSINFAQTFGIPSQCPVACPEIFALFFNGLDPVIFGGTTDTFERVSPGGGVNWKVNDDVLAYAKVVTGFKAGGFNSISGSVDGLSFDQETTIGYEIGAKTQWFDDRLTLNVAAFLQDRKDALVSVADPAMPINSLGVNAGKIKNKGFEIEFAARPVKGLNLQAAFGYLDAEFKEFKLGEGDDAVDFAGNKVPRTFKYSFTGVVSYTHPLTDNFDGFAYLFYRNAWDGFTDNDNIEKMSKPELVDVRLGLKGDNWKLVGYVDNLFDNRYTSTEFRSIYDNGRHFGVFAPGRTYGIQGVYEF